MASSRVLHHGSSSPFTCKKASGARLPRSTDATMDAAKIARMTMQNTASPTSTYEDSINLAPINIRTSATPDFMKRNRCTRDAITKYKLRSVNMVKALDVKLSTKSMLSSYCDTIATLAVTLSTAKTKSTAITVSTTTKSIVALTSNHFLLRDVFELLSTTNEGALLGLSSPEGALPASTVTGPMDLNWSPAAGRMKKAGSSA
mmetsp:Transcript_41271/g.74622  ORF Transcript_41271/g.74622 Transcript_41271/m.74622 type:complete len:203 (-) Transcript_41271:585-1193(-)